MANNERPDGDLEMADAEGGAEEGSVASGGNLVEPQRLRLVREHGIERWRVELLTDEKLQGSSNTAASFAFDKEDHTLGNALRYLITKNPDVEFCGYSIPHPSEAVMNLRIQTWDDLEASGVTVFTVLEKALQDLTDLCDVVEEKFTVARDGFNAAHPDRVEHRNDE